MIQDIGFIGLGQMGKWMALNLVKSKFNMIVSDIDPAAVDFLTEQGAKPAESPAKLSPLVGMIILSLPDSDVIDEVIFGENGIIHGAKAGLIVVDCGTSGYLWSQKTAESLEEHKIHFLDAPVNGLEQRAKDGTLTIMVGGTKDLVEKIETTLDAIGETIIHMGPVGNGQLAKTVNNVIYNANMATLAEMLPMAVKLGLEPGKIAEVINTGSGRSFASEFYIPKIIEGRFENAYRLSNAFKDMQNLAEISRRFNISLPIFQASLDTYRKALDDGFGNEDKGAMIKVFEKEMGVLFRSGK